MKENAPLRINIPKPCTQNWDAMSNRSNGRYCSQCNNIVVDFSQMSDAEVFHFFKQQPGTHCGHFHDSQLNRDILPVATRRKLLISKFNKIAAALLTVLSFKNITYAKTEKNSAYSLEQNPNYKLKLRQPPGGEFIISGTVKDGNGKPVEKATVTFDSTVVATTDAEGKFSVELAAVSASSHNLYFSYRNLITTVRNYHPAMLAANYEVVLNEKTKACESHTRGIMLPPWANIEGLPSLIFKKEGTRISAENKIKLSVVANKLKGNPFAKIIVQSYPGVCGHQFIFSKRVENIKNYLVNAEGIAPDRIQTNCEVGGGDQTVVDILVQKD